jgi:hypothetical protein
MRARQPVTTFELPSLALLSLLFTGVFLTHITLLRLPYFWDEAGYYIPAARDLLTSGTLIPHSTISNPHPPLVMAWLALWWKLSGYTPAVTRTAMLLISAFGLLGVFRLARHVANTPVAIASTLLTALYPVWFAQSSLAHLDLAAAAFTLWGLDAYVRRHRWIATAWFALAGISKETAIVAPLALLVWELLSRIAAPRFRESEIRIQNSEFEFSWPLTLALLPLMLWLCYFRVHTGFWFGNPEFFRYNVAATMNPLRIVLAMIERIWQALGYMNLFALTGAMALALLSPPLPGREHDQIAIPTQLVFSALLLAYILMLSVLGGAVLARYMLPVIPLVIILSVSTLRRRVPWWKWLIALTAVGFLVALISNPLYRTAPEDNLNYADFVKLHKRAADLIEQRYSHSHVLTAWPASDELTHPYLGYVKQPVSVVRIDNFTAEQLALAAQAKEQYDVALLFSTKLEPDHPLFDRFGWWRRIDERFFDYHRDLPPEVASQMLGGTVVFEAHRNGQWIAIVEFPRIFNAGNRPAALPAPARQRRAS